MELILASGSPRRRELLGILNIPFSVVVSDADETVPETLDAATQAVQVSCRKAQAVKADPSRVVIAADTVVVCDGVVLGKPKDEADAKRMLQMLSGRSHQVITGLCVSCGNKQLTAAEVTEVRFRPLSDRDIDRYIRTKDPMDKAGAYGIQSGAAVFVEGICGDYFNVVGLPLCRLEQMLRRVAPQLMEE